jgi:hypothetical protein
VKSPGIGLSPILFAAVCLAFWMTAISAGTQTADDPDVWWVAAAGRDMLASGDVPRTNGWSITDARIPWVMHEWLLAVPYAVGTTALGPRFFALAALFFTVAAGLALVATSFLRVENFAAAALVSLYGFGFFSLRMTAGRPTNVSLPLAIAIAALAFAPSFGRRHIAAAALLEVVWANVHGTFPLGIVLLLGGALERRDRGNRVLAAAFAAVLTLANPYGWKLHALVWHYFRGDEPIFAYIRDHIIEFGPVWRSDEFLYSRPGFGFVALWVLPLAALTVPKWRIRSALSLLLLAQALLHFRQAEMSGLVTLVLLGPYLGELMDGWRLPARHPFPAYATAAIVVTGGVLIGLGAHGIVAIQRSDEGWVGRYASFVRMAGRIPDGANVFTAFGRAGVVIWMGAPRRVRVLYDSRNDCYSAGVAADAIELTFGGPSSERVVEILDRYHVDHVLMPEDHRVGAALLRSSRWRVAAADPYETLSLFEKTP